MPLVEHDHVVQALPPDGADDSFHIGILSGDRGAVTTSSIPMALTLARTFDPYTASPSRIMWRGIVFQGNASVIC